jgi:iron complex outermembrane receptor protein
LKITTRDNTFKDAGKIGLWTKADSVIYFDDLTVEDLGSARSALLPGQTLAQRLVDELAKKHPELVRIGLHATPAGSSENIIVASNVAAKLGQKSDPEDLRAMETGRPVVLREGENFDVTLPLHDATGKVIGAIGLTLRPNVGEQERDATRRARAIASELENQVPSKDSLFGSKG